MHLVRKNWQRRGVGSAVALLFAAFGFGAVAQAPPDAGQIQRDIERSRVPGLAPRPPAAPLVEEPVRPALQAPDTARFPVKGFRISGAAAIPETELLPLLKEFISEERSLADLRRAADVVARYYRDRGYFVSRAYIPAQDIRDGIVEITVVEGRLDGISLKMDRELRLKGTVVERTLREALPPGGVIRQAELERGLLLLNDLPGVEVRAALSPGASTGTTLLTAEVTEGPLVTGNVDFDNYGNKFSGAYRLGATLNLNDPSGRGDLLALRALASSGVRYGRLAYQLPIGVSGLKAGAAYAETRYELCCEFSALEARGEARVATLNAQYPFIRGRNFSLYGGASYDDKRFFNSTISGTTSDRRANVLTLGVWGDSVDFRSGGGLNTFGLALAAGNLNLDRWEQDRTADDATARAQGGYRKVSYSLARLQKLGEATSIYAAFSGQFASKNLDSSEKFVLGGPLGVRAYPQGEASGDEGLLLNVELRYDAGPGLQLVAFLDHGEIRLHRNEWAGWQGVNSNLSNRYGLSGYGFGLNWNQPGSVLVRAVIAQRIGGNPGQDVNGNNSDNAGNRPRIWLQAVKYF